MTNEDLENEDTEVASQPNQLRTGALSPEASRMFRVYRTMSNLLQKRGYMVPREMREMTPASFVSKFGERPARESLTILVVSVGCILCTWLSVFFDDDIFMELVLGDDLFDYR